MRGPLAVRLVFALLLVKDLPEDTRSRCAACGTKKAELFLHPPTKALEGFGGDEVQFFCATCYCAAGKDECRIVVTRRHAGRPSEDPDERFGELFKAARILL